LPAYLRLNNDPSILNLYPLPLERTKGKDTLSYGKLVGFILDGATPVYARFVSADPPPIGDYVVVEAEKPILGLVEKVGTRSLTLSFIESYTPSIFNILSRELAAEVYFECSIRLLGDLENLQLPRKPPLPGAKVFRADTDILRGVFGGSPPYKIKIGRLAARPDVEVYIDVNSLVTRHTAILAVTGAGKSNTVAVIVDQLVRIGGTVVILDFHGEYRESSLGGGKVNVIEPRINPALLSTAELMTLLGIEKHYYNQERALRRALKNVKDRGTGFLDELVNVLEHMRVSRREEAGAIAAVINKIESFRERYSEIIDENAPSMISRIRIGYANIVDLSRVDRDAADALVSHLLRTLLNERKMYRVLGKSLLPVPVLVVVEEAHILAPRDEDTLSRYWMARIAREGRKFGVGLMLVSQRPKNLDPDILSQANNLIVLRLLEPSDQRYVQEASEALTDDLVEQLPALNTGEAIIVGPFTRLPALVKIDKYEGRLGGADVDVVAEWRKATEVYTRTDEESIDYIVSKLI
jgi:DNA helicase HerA-like ATPase